MPRITDYRMIVERTDKQLEEAVNTLLPDWQPYGSPHAADDFLFQAMVKYEVIVVVDEKPNPYLVAPSYDTVSEGYKP